MREAMKKINTFIIIVLVIALLTNPVFGYAGMGGNNSGVNMGNITQNEPENLDPANITESDLNIMLIQHLIEVDAARFEDQNRIYVRETIVFKNIGDMNFQGTLRTWVPDGSEAVKVGRAPMVMDGSVVPINAIQNGNIISWQDLIKINNQPFPMYTLEYVVPAQAEGSISKSRHYTKKFIFPTLITKVPSNVVVKVTKGKDESVIIKDEKGNNLQSSGRPTDEDNSVLYTFDAPQFKEIDIEFSSALGLSQIAPYLIFGILIVIVLAYPVIRKKSTKLQEIEERIKNSLKREPEGEEEQETYEEGSKDEADQDDAEEEPEEIEEEYSTHEDKDLLGKSKDELETEKNELLSKLEKLEKDYASGDLIDEEYEELRNSYQKKLKKIERRIE